MDMAGHFPPSKQSPAVTYYLSFIGVRSVSQLISFYSS